ncbi:sensor domain-containing protein [Frankia sp. Mgl5]|uniref:sensor histidine kinase n=1 Tax=Frankia sp. Mgl5 TaxID=2933793 RepID=UPI00200C6820|nr:sensor domain-containing protein [Frankia sp. Mgl5]MCK9930023.1 sensor domain-containing protein [Frankia sp. Mgl5]
MAGPVDATSDQRTERPVAPPAGKEPVPDQPVPDQPGAGAGVDARPEQVFALDNRTWRRVLFLLLNLPTGLVGFVFVVVWFSVGVGMAVTVVGLPLLTIGLVVTRALGTVERARARVILGLHIPSASRPRSASTGAFGRLWAGVADPVGWRHALYFVIRLPWAIVTFTVTLVLLFVGWPVLPVVARALAAVDRAMISALLSPSDRMERRIRELEADRGVVVDTAAADLRRIERDLHDGAQARLVALAMGLGLAREKFADDPDTAAKMVEEAHGEVKLALRELRDLARGIHPAILTDRGLPGAIPSLGMRCTVPVRVTVELDERPAPAIEGIVYFTAAELLTNISKHSQASDALVDLRRVGDNLLLRITDDGRGGASLGRGSGLAGLTERLDAIDGTLIVDSPPGGPTYVIAKVPWRDREQTQSG